MTIIIPGRPQRPITVQPGRDLPPGGTAGQALIKSSDSDFATTWGTASASAAWGFITGTLSAQTDLQADLDAKQATLVSAVNIKTLNGSTILGSGDLVISASAAWGGITGTLSSQTDLVTDQNARDTNNRARANHTGTQAAATITGLATVATSGSAADLGTGTLPAARLPAFGSGDVSFAASGGAGTIAAGAVTLAKQANMATASVVYRKTAGSGAPEVQTLATLKTDLGLTGTNSGDQTITLTSDVTGSGAGSFATTIAANAVTNAKRAQLATARIRGRVTAGTGDTEDLTGTQATTLLDTFTSAAKGLAPASGGGTTNFLRADGTWAAPGGGGAPGGSTGEIQYNNGGAFDGSADVEIEGGQLRLPSIATPTAPAADGIKLYSKDIVGCDTPAYLIPSAQGQAEFLLQRMMGEGNFLLFLPGGGTTVTSLGAASTGTGTATAANVTNSTKRQRLKRIEYLVTVAATTAVAGWYHNASQHTVGGGNAWEGGFTFSMFGGPATGVATASSRFFMGMRDAGGPTDVEPSTFLRCIGIGYDSADTNLQFMHNDATGTATKIDLGASFAVPTTDRSVIWRLRMFSPPGTTQQVDYEVLNIDTGAIATGTVTTDLPSTTSFISPRIQSSAGGTSSVIGVAVGPVQVHVEL